MTNKTRKNLLVSRHSLGRLNTSNDLLPPPKKDKKERIRTVVRTPWGFLSAIPVAIALLTGLYFDQSAGSIGGSVSRASIAA